MNPYEPEKVSMANELYSEVLETDVHDDGKLKELRLRAIEELGIKFSTELLYEKLTAACNPKNFTGEAYNKERLELANRLYQEVLMNADNVFALEGIEEEAKELMNNMTANTALEKQSDKDNNDGCLTYLIIISVLCLCFLLITLLVMVFNAN